MSYSPVPSVALGSRARMILALILVVAVSTLACGGAGAGDSASQGTEATGESADTADTASDTGPASDTDSAEDEVPAASDAAASALLPPMPEAAAEDGTLPRVFLGWELGGPAPDAERSAEDRRYDGTVRHWNKVSDSPDTFHRAFVRNGQIFRIEWMVDAPDLDRSEVAAALAEHLGEPDEKSPYLPDNHEMWSDGLSEGDTTWWVGRPHNGDHLVVAVMDSWLDADAIDI